MSKLILEARKFKTWELLHNMTGLSRSYCKKVMIDTRKRDSDKAKLIVEKFNELEKMLIK
ncbi:hypothetical protein [Flavobacterium frigoris]|uniref:Uncharacterized protein n=1 Tax=Flavobacterium frigoris TaxID=229204 RepID=A0A1H9LHF5_FLAFI|nr:hypothetical protein [Flavobacterium frigoris]SER10820.1 hypothetical protein SAMN05444355_10734 [Flavobacterium frigoris]